MKVYISATNRVENFPEEVARRLIERGYATPVEEENDSKPIRERAVGGPERRDRRYETRHFGHHG